MSGFDEITFKSAYKEFKRRNTPLIAPSAHGEIGVVSGFNSLYGKKVSSTVSDYEVGFTSTKMVLRNGKATKTVSGRELKLAYQYPDNLYEIFEAFFYEVPAFAGCAMAYIEGQTK